MPVGSANPCPARPRSARLGPIAAHRKLWGPTTPFLRRLIVTAVLVVGAQAPASAQIPPPEGPNCHPSYRGACLPLNGPDVDCEGGTGNGPIFVGRVFVVGPDVYGLDRDGNGIGCE
jgi:hypothetical protein